MISTTQIKELLYEQDYKCALTGVTLEPRVAALDHKEARTKGGSDEKENLHIVHETINRMKHTLSVSEFIYWCRLVVEYQQEKSGFAQLDRMTMQ